MKKAASVMEKAIAKSNAKSGMGTIDEDSMMENQEAPEYEKHEIEGAADTIMKAHEHMANPKLMKHVNPILERRKKGINSIRSIADLRKKADEVGRLKKQEES